MDLEQNNNQRETTGSPPSQPIPPPAQGMVTIEPRRRRSGWRIFWGIVLTLSILANILLLLMLIGVSALIMTGHRGVLTEEVIQKGPQSTKIAVIKVQGLIDDRQRRDVYRQLERARQDKRVKGLIIRVYSPGGTIAGSDQIYNEIVKYKDKTGKPVVAFMQGVAASGGYYVSVACDKIVAEQTAITGSIGVIFAHFIFKDLLEEKLGIEPVIITAGKKKGWLSPFEPVTVEQRQYIEDKLISPAYERFKDVVASGRKKASLTPKDVDRLADGGIYWAQEALDERLIDKIGYFDQAVQQVKLLADIEKARVVEYRKPFSLAGLLSLRAGNILRIDRNTLYELSTPQLLYLWTMQQ